jgi:23S rRNA C2498 (ribose-2'-O)-methylase RlmM
VSAAPALAAKPRKRVSKTAALYQDGPKDIRSCASCTLFERPDRCKAVIGKVSPNGWCRLYDMAD